MSQREQLNGERAERHIPSVSMFLGLAQRFCRVCLRVPIAGSGCGDKAISGHRPVQMLPDICYAIVDAFGRFQNVRWSLSECWSSAGGVSQIFIPVRGYLRRRSPEIQRKGFSEPTKDLKRSKESARGAMFDGGSARGFIEGFSSQPRQLKLKARPWYPNGAISRSSPSTTNVTINVSCNA